MRILTASGFTKFLSFIRDLCINRNNHQKSTFHPLGGFLNPALALLGQGLNKSPMIDPSALRAAKALSVE
jgi:hypothetical protein